MASSTRSNLPVIEFSMENLNPGTNSWSLTRTDVVRALEDYGCFIAVYDKVSLELHNAIFSASKELLDLPTETKVLNTSTTPSHGYVGQEPVLAELDQLVMRMVSQSYGVEKYYDLLLGSTSYLLRLIKYRGPQPDEKKLGIVPHTDKSFMSILHQRQVKGLEIKTKDGEWILVDPSPSSSFVVMAGDACMAWTNGRIEPPSHRVIMCGEEERYSLGLFTFIRDLTIQIPEELADAERPLQYEAFDHYKFIDFYYTDEGKRSKCAIKSYCGV
ncbi:hypothetical protein RJ640_008665 [Escallonia rubra]|uniref:Fe2OG dioxygenase domain-containing protein n=1 Tax=Escallonia rubra TaxID=112253 RepID=A0AA88UHD6_9ASTE|nr:hypothetical protein RJ640_008665 [Escallonia rubra]